MWNQIACLIGTDAVVCERRVAPPFGEGGGCGKNRGPDHEGIET